MNGKTKEGGERERERSDVRPQMPIETRRVLIVV
jgi:hypothetical protein